MGLSKHEIESRLTKPGQQVWVERGIYALKRKSGIRYGISYLHGTKRVQRMIGTNLSRARKELAKVKADMDRGQYEEKKKVPTFDDLADQYLRFAKQNKKKTVDSLDALYIRRFKKHFANQFISLITTGDIQEYKAKRKDDKVPNNPKKTIEPRTVNMEIKLLIRMFNLAIKHWKYLTYNPASEVEMLPDPEKPNAKRILEEHEEPILLEALPPHLRPVLLLGIHTGMRSRSELLALRWDCVDMRRRVVTVKAAKTEKGRVIELNDKAFQILSEIHKHHQVGHVFLYRGEPLKEFSKAWKNAVKRAGIPHITIHQATRHTFGTRLARKGVELHEIKRLMGHASITTTERYLHSNAERRRAAVNKLVE